MRYFIFLSLFISSSAFGISQEYIQKSLQKAADKVGIPVELLDAICYAESRHDVDAYVFSDGGSTTNHAYGMCQVLYNTAKDFGLKNDRCSDDFRFRKAERTYKHCKLFGPYTNALYAAKYIKHQLDRYDNSWINAIAAFNSGSVQICKTGWVYRYRKDSKGKSHKTKLYKCEKGGLLNQRYVDRVLHAFLERGSRDESSRLSEIQKIADAKEKSRAVQQLVVELGATPENTGITRED